MKSNKFREFGQTVQDRDAPVVQPVFVTEGSGAIVVIAITLFSVVVMYVTSRNSESAWSSIWGTVIFFSLALPTGLMAANGTFAAMFRTWQEQRTIIILNHPGASQRAQNTLGVVSPPQLPYSPPVDPVALPASPNFVSPHAEPDDSAKREAAAWLLQLYGPDGHPDPKKVLLKSDKERPGRVRIAAPSRPAKEYLIDRRIIHDLGNGYRLNLTRCSTITAAQNNLSLTGVGGARTPLPLPTTPQYSGEGVQS